MIQMDHLNPEWATLLLAVRVEVSLAVRDPHSRRPVERRAVDIERRPVHHGIAGSAMPTSVATAAVT